ncbi:MAG: 50S ribosomal protein L13 [Coxiella sp. (in: Bacteria)]|nr:MAG: 50S ribosomal protein L13 [Coxiella sp. (in: g-proteobacteria)]
MKTYMAKAENMVPKWYLVDASGLTLGRLASRLALRLRGKDKPTFTPHADTGDFFIVINVDKLTVTGNKMKDKIYYRHTGYPGGIREESFGDLHKRIPSRVLEVAVKGMLPKGPLGRKIFKKLKVFAGGEHPHASQKPELVEL